MRRGSVVEIGENRGLRYRIVHIEEGLTWLTPTVKDIVPDCIAPVDQLREVGSFYPNLHR